MIKKIIFLIALYFSFGLSQTVEQSKTSYGIKFLSFKYKANEHFTGISLPLISGTGVSEKFTGIDIGLFLSGCPKIKYYPKYDSEIQMLRVKEFKGIAISGLINSMWKMQGISITSGLTSANSFSGISFSGLSVIDNFNGFSASWLLFVSDNTTGFSFGGLISGGVDFTGVSSSFLISGAKHFKGLSIGSISLIDEEMVGLQIGIINYAKYLKGIQIGVVNIAKNAMFPYTVGINWNF